MPTYDYECQACGETLEVFQRISESPKKKCPACGKLRLKRLIGQGGGIIFKGSGFYITDYRSSDYRAKAKAESDGGKSSSEKGAGSGSGSDKKSDASSGASKSTDGSSSGGAAKKASGADG